VRSISVGRMSFFRELGLGPHVALAQSNPSYVGTDGLAIVCRTSHRWVCGPSPFLAGRSVTITETAERIIVRMGELLVEATQDSFHLCYCATGEPFLEEAVDGDCLGPTGTTACGTR
jgi:hypothetical protein